MLIDKNTISFMLKIVDSTLFVFRKKAKQKKIRYITENDKVSKVATVCARSISWLETRTCIV